MKRDYNVDMKPENMKPKSNGELLSEIRKIRDRGKQLGLRDDEIHSIMVEHDNGHSSLSLRVLKFKIFIRNRLRNKTYKKRAKRGVALLFSLVFAYFLSPVIPGIGKYIFDTFVEDPCLLSVSEIVSEALRSPVPCGICKNLTHVPTRYNITPEEFSLQYAYTGVPLLVKDAISDWGALKSFSYIYLKDLYQNTDGALDYVADNCQFFNYKTEFKSLDEVFEMPDDRASLKNGTKAWYVGWSNCDTESDVGVKLRSQYSRPYFLPIDSTALGTDWIFMGGPGHGAFMHIDSVDRPSWQAQISGKKTWTLEPSPECASVCKTLQVTVEKGDIIVLDTNIWYHKTVVNRGDISITIGAEYD